MRKAKVIYNDVEDQFEIQINTGDGWGLESAYPCHTSTKNPMGDANFIHFTVLKSLAMLENFGYTITFEEIL